MKNFRDGFTGVLMVIAYILMGLYHLWTAILAFSNYGIVWGILALCVPIVSELLLNGIYIGVLGFFNSYTLAIIGIFILYGIAFIIASKEKTNG